MSTNNKFLKIEFKKITYIVATKDKEHKNKHTKKNQESTKDFRGVLKYIREIFSSGTELNLLGAIDTYLIP